MSRREDIVRHYKTLTWKEDGKERFIWQDDDGRWRNENGRFTKNNAPKGAEFSIPFPHAADLSVEEGLSNKALKILIGGLIIVAFIVLVMSILAST